MLHPSYSDLMRVVNSGVGEGDEPVVSSRYSIVIAAAKRARQIINGAEPLIENWEGMKPLSIAVEEIYQGKVHILGIDETDDEISLDLDFGNDILDMVFVEGEDGEEEPLDEDSERDEDDEDEEEEDDEY